MTRRVSDSAQQQSPVVRALHQFMQETTRQLIATALEEELQHFLHFHADIRLPDGTRAVVRNGYLPIRTIFTSVGDIAVRVPRTRDRSNAGIHFSSLLLPRYHSRSRVDNLLPETFLRSYLDSDARKLLRVVLGPQVEQVPGIILTNVQNQWSARCLEWQRKSLATTPHLFWWAGSLPGAITETDLLFIIGLHHDGRHELVTVAEVARDAESAWLGLLRQLRQQGVHNSPKLLDAGRRPDVWQAAQLYYPETLIIGQDNQTADPHTANLPLPVLRYV